MLKKVILVMAGVILLAGLVAYGLFYKSDMSREELAEVYVTEASQFAKLPNGASMHYRIEGNPNGQTLVMIHGGFGSLHNWEGWVSHLKDEFHLVSLDLLGHGLTGTYPDHVYNRLAQRDAVHQLLQQLEIDRYALAGNSFGGGIAIEMALAYPEEVEGLLLVGSEGVPNSEDGYDTSRFIMDGAVGPDDPTYSAVSLAEQIGSKFIGPEVIAASLDSMVHDRKLLTKAFVDKFAKVLRHKGNREAQILMFRQGMHLISTNGKMDLLPRLKDIRSPTLVMQGRSDTLVPMRVAEIFDREIPSSELAVVEDAGHIPMMEKPAETAQLVKAFLNAH